MLASHSSMRQLRHAFFLLSLQQLTDEREDEEREDRAPDKGIDDHQHPPEQASGGCAEGIGDDVAWLTKEPLEEQEEYKMHHAQRDIREQKRLHRFLLSSFGAYYLVFRRRLQTRLEAFLSTTKYTKHTKMFLGG